MKHTAVTCNMPVIDLLQKVAWPMYEQYSSSTTEEDGEVGHALDGLQKILLYVSLFFLLLFVRQQETDFCKINL